MYYPNRAQIAQEQFLSSIHLACQRIQQVYRYALHKSLLFRIGDTVQ